MRVFLNIMLGILLVIISRFMPADLVSAFVSGGIILVAAVFVVDLPLYLVERWKYVRFDIIVLMLSLVGQKIRFSMAYQFRIRIDGEYLLVKNSNFDWFQLVGGKYKRFPQADRVFDDLKISYDTRLGSSKQRKDDLAVFVPAKSVKKFLRWFESSHDREVNHQREFYEELVAGKTKFPQLNGELFGTLRYRFIDTVRTPIRRSPADSGWNCWECHYYDVLEPVFTTEQEAALGAIRAVGDTEYVKWAKQALIDTCGFNPVTESTPYRIGIHTKWAINQKWSKE